MEVKVTKHYLEVGTVKYFRGKADGVELGSYGEKKDPIGAQAHLDVQNKIKYEYLADRIIVGTTADIKISNTSESIVEENGNLKIFGIGISLGESTSYKDAVKMKLKLRKFFINRGPLETTINQDAAGCRKYLAEEGNDARVVCEVWVVMTAEMSHQFDTAKETTIGVSALGQGIEIVTKNGASGNQTVVLSPGTTFAYLMAKVQKWTDKHKTKIESLELDYKGMN